MLALLTVRSGNWRIIHLSLGIKLFVVVELVYGVHVPWLPNDELTLSTRSRQTVMSGLRQPDVFVQQRKPTLPQRKMPKQSTRYNYLHRSHRHPPRRTQRRGPILYTHEERVRLPGSVVNWRSGLWPPESWC